MPTSPLQRAAAELGWDYQHPFAYAAIDQFHWTISFLPTASQLVVQVNVAPLTNEHIAALNRYLVEHRKDIGATVQVNTNILLTFAKPIMFGGIKSQQLSDLIQLLAQGLHQAGVSIATHCGLCEKESTDTTALINGVLVNVHQSCKDQAIADIAREVEASGQQEPHVLKGLLGALIGAMLGSIPWILVDLFVGFYAAILGILIGYSALYFYKQFGAKVVKATRYVIIAATIFGVLFANFAIATYIIVNSDGLLIFENYVIVYTDPEIGPLMLQSLGIGLFITLFSLPTIFRKVVAEELPKVTII